MQFWWKQKVLVELASTVEGQEDWVFVNDGVPNVEMGGGKGKERPDPVKTAPAPTVDEKINEPVDDRNTPSDNQESSPPAPPQSKPVPPKPSASTKTARTKNVEMGGDKGKEKPGPVKRAPDPTINDSIESQKECTTRI